MNLVQAKICQTFKKVIENEMIKRSPFKQRATGFFLFFKG